MKFSKVVPLLVLSFFLITCSGSNQNAGGPAPDPETDLSSGQKSLQNHDYLSAKESFCADPSTSQLAFGCAMTQVIALGESEPVKALLKGIGQQPVDIQTSFFSKGKFFDTLLTKYYSKTEDPSLKDFDYLPIVKDFANDSYGGKDLIEEISKNMLITDMTVAEVQEQLKKLLPDLINIHNLLELAKADSSFSFIIPKEFFYTNEDVTILPADLYVFDTAIQSARLVIELLYRYEPVVDVAKVYTSKDSFDVKGLADCLNGVYGNTFGTLKSNYKDFTDLKPLIENVLSNGMLMVTKLPQVGATKLFHEIIEHHLSKFTKTQQLITELQTSLTGQMIPLSIVNGKVSVNVQKFLSSPPDASKVTDVDPFDYTAPTYNTKYKYYYGEDLKMVEGFFKKLFDKMASF